MRRVLFVATSTTLGGAEKTLFTLATSLDPGRFSVAGVVSLKPAGAYARKLAALGVPVFCLDQSVLPSPKSARALSAIIERERPDVVCAVMYQAIQLCRWVKRRGSLQFRLVSSPRVNYRTRPRWTLLVDRWLRDADDLLIAESRASRDFLVDRLGYSREKVRAIHNGVAVAGEAIPEPERRAKREELLLGAEELLVGAVGRLDEQKGHEILIEAMARLRGTCPARCAILGDGPARGRLEAQIRRLGLEGRVRLLGERDDAAPWLASFDIFALPSLWEGLPNALLEAMSLGLPVVASAVDGVCEAVADGRNGLLVPPKDPAALAQAVKSLCDDRGARERLGSAARRTVAEHFGLREMLSAYEDAL